MFDAEFTDGNLGDNFQTQEMRRFPEGSKEVMEYSVSNLSYSLHKTYSEMLNMNDSLDGIYFLLWQKRTMTQTTAKNNLTKTEVLGTLSD